MNVARRAMSIAATTILLAVPALAQDAGDEPRPKKPRSFEHPSVRLGAVQLEARGLLQANALTSNILDADDEGSLDLSHRRVGIHGGVGKVLDFQVEGEVGTPGPWRDVYADYRQFDVVRIRAGQFKVPFSLERNTGVADLDFAFRSESATELTPGRQRGIMAHGRIAKRVLEYEVGVFHELERDDEIAWSSRTAAGRVTLRPFGRLKSTLADLHVAAALTEGTLSEGISALRGRTAADTPFFSRSYWVKGSRERSGLEARWRPGPVSLTWEWMRVTDQRRDQGVGDGDLAPLTAVGSYVSGTWAITGEPKSRGMETPLHPLLQGGIGAIEVAGRLEHIRFGDGIRDSAASLNPRAPRPVGNTNRIVTAGVNWYWNRWAKVQANVIRESPGDRGTGMPQVWSRVLQVQLTL